MYIHPKTELEEFPRTYCEILHNSVDILAKEFPERTIPYTRDFGVPAYSWHGAGSMKGGSAEHIAYNNIVFLPAEKDKSIMVTSGSKHSSIHKGPHLLLPDGNIAFRVEVGYSVLARMQVPENTADKIITFYNNVEKVREKPEGHDNDYRYLMAIDELLTPATREYRSIALWAFDKYESIDMREGFFTKSEYHVHQHLGNLSRVWNEDWHWKYTGSKANREELSLFLADFSRGRTEFDNEFYDFKTRTLMAEQRRLLSLSKFSCEHIEKKLKTKR
tara:strand:- start:34954 stop:35778 length:825 start_codon:yes stop_codon:yes gene_type:complete